MFKSIFVRMFKTSEINILPFDSSGDLQGCLINLDSLSEAALWIAERIDTADFNQPGDDIVMIDENGKIQEMTYPCYGEHCHDNPESVLEESVHLARLFGGVALRDKAGEIYHLAA